MDGNYNNSYSYGNGQYNWDDNGRKNDGFGRGVALGIVISVFAFLCIILLSYFMREEGSSGRGFGSWFDDGFFTDEEMQKLELIQAYIDQFAYYEQDREFLMDNIYLSVLYSLDDNYAAYYNKEAYDSLMAGSSGEYSGIGCVVRQDVDTGYVIVVQPYVNSPAYDAGIAIGDIIWAADGVVLTGMDLNEAVSYIQGKEGTSVEITYIHEGEEHTVSVERRSIEVPTIEYEMMNGNIGYIKITDFDTVTVPQFETALQELMSDGAKGFIFDVRSNPGGLYDSVVSMLDTLLPEGTIVYTEDKYGYRETETSDAECIELPMAVLINGESASASEIFAGALQDYGVAEIIGTKSFGKGIVQSVIPLGDGTGIKFTVSSYFTPNGVCIHGIGIKPDRTVELTEDDDAYDENGYLKREYDTQLDAAIEYMNEVIE